MFFASCAATAGHAAVPGPSIPFPVCGRVFGFAASAGAAARRRRPPLRPRARLSSSPKATSAGSGASGCRRGRALRRRSQRTSAASRTEARARPSRPRERRSPPASRLCRAGLAGSKWLGFWQATDHCTLTGWPGFGTTRAEIALGLVAVPCAYQIFVPFSRTAWPIILPGRQPAAARRWRQQARARPRRPSWSAVRAHRWVAV